MNEPYPQTHPAMAVARNIVDQILEEAGTDIATRQRINDDCDRFAARLIKKYAAAERERIASAIEEEPIRTMKLTEAWSTSPAQADIQARALAARIARGGEGRG